MRLDEVVLFDRLRVLSGRHLDSPLRDFATLVGSSPGSFLSDAELDDFLAPLARYLRQSWEYLEELPLARLISMHKATSRLIKIENGAREPLNPAASTEENR